MTARRNDFQTLNKTKRTAREEQQAEHLESISLTTLKGQPRKRRTQREVATNLKNRRETGLEQSHKLGKSLPTTIYLPVAVNERLAELAFLNRKDKISRNDIVLAAIDMYFKKHGLEGVDKLIGVAEPT